MDKVSWRLNFNRTRCPDNASTIGHQINSVVVNQTGKVDVHVTDNQYWNSCFRVISDYGVTFGFALEPPKKHDAL